MVPDASGSLETLETLDSSLELRWGIGSQNTWSSGLDEERSFGG